MDTNSLIGKNLGGYKIVGFIGAGGMATVYKAYQESLNRYVAIKVLAAHLSGDQEFRERFSREAKSIAKLRHPNI
jgi:serine/threonine protein kinase